MKSYLPRNVIKAGKIEKMDGTMITVDGDDCEVSHQWIAAHQPRVGDYLVNGDSVTIGEVFEENYVEVKPKTVKKPKDK